MSILIVEDNPLSATVLESNLAKQGWAVQRARDGRAALDVLERCPDVELLITDIQMPEMDGLELIASIRARAEWKGLPILVATARASADLVTRAACLGVRHLAVKPFNVVQLVQQVREVLRAELPTLRSAQHVQVTLGVNRDGYRTLLRGFDELVAGRLETLAAVNAGEAPASGIGAGLIELRESATLVGADRVVAAIDAVAAGGTTDAAASLVLLVRELHRLRAALTRAGGAGTAPATSDAATDGDPAPVPSPADEPAV